MKSFGRGSYWGVVKIVVPFWVLKILRHLVFRGPKRGPYFDNHPHDPPLYWHLGPQPGHGKSGSTSAPRAAVRASPKVSKAQSLLPPALEAPNSPKNRSFRRTFFWAVWSLKGWSDSVDDIKTLHIMPW